LRSRCSGLVGAFDAAVGLGSVDGDDGTRYPFHCTQIADGSREVAGGSRIDFVVVPGHLGRWEAADIRVL
jgi:CspA family cold shock protein